MTDSKVFSTNGSASWREFRFGDVCDFQGGTQPPKATFQRSCLPGLIRLLQIQDFRTDEYAVYVEDDPRLTKCSEDDVLIGRYGASVGKIFRGKAGAINVALVKVIPDTRVLDPGFLFFWFQHEIFQRAVARVSARAAQAGFNKQDLANLPLNIPPLEEQRRIAARLREQLSILEEARAPLEAQLAAAESLPAAHLRAVFASEEAKHWPRVPLEELCYINASQVNPTQAEFADLPHVSGENIETGTLQLIGVRSAGEDRMISGKYLFEQGDVLYSKLRPYLRKVAIAPSRGLCSADMYPLRMRAERMDARYAAWLLLSHEFTKYAIRESQRSRMPKLNREQLFAWNAPMPSLETQRSIAAQLDTAFSRTHALRESLQEKLTEVEKLPASLLRSALCAHGGQGFATSAFNSGATRSLA